MNEHEFKGAVRHVKGRAETAVGGVSGDLGRQAEGLIDQVAGGAQHVYGKLTDEADDLVDRGRTLAREAGSAGRRLARDTRDRAEELGEAGADVVREARVNGMAYARRVARHADDNRLAAILGIAAVGFLVGWLARPAGPRRDRS